MCKSLQSCPTLCDPIYRLCHLLQIYFSFCWHSLLKVFQREYIHGNFLIAYIFQIYLCPQNGCAEYISLSFVDSYNFLSWKTLEYFLGVPKIYQHVFKCVYKESFPWNNLFQSEYLCLFYNNKNFILLSVGLFYFIFSVLISWNY